MNGNKQITRKQNMETGIVLALVAIFVYLKWDFTPGLWISIVLLSLVLLLPILLFPLAYIWFALAQFLSWFSSRLLLIILFFLLVTPVAFVRKLMRKDSLQLKAFKKDCTTAFIEKNRKFTASDLKYPF